MPGEYIFELVGGQRVIFSSPPGESTWHVALKLLAFLLYRRRAPLVERSVGQRFKPDLVVLRDGRVRLWIDCGETSLRKLDRVVAGNPGARIVIVKDTARRLDLYSNLAAGALRDGSRVCCLAFSDGLVAGMARDLRQRNRVASSFGPAGLSIELNGDSYQGTLYRRGIPGGSASRSQRRRSHVD